MASKRLIVPEVVQTSAMDCGPACLSSLLQGFDIRVSYERLREACQTDVDGTSIDTLEEVAIQLELEAEQIMVPIGPGPGPGTGAPARNRGSPPPQQQHALCCGLEPDQRPHADHGSSGGQGLARREPVLVFSLCTSYGRARLGMARVGAFGSVSGSTAVQNVAAGLPPPGDRRASEHCVGQTGLAGAGRD